MNFLEEEKKKKAFEIFTILKKEYPDARCLLNYKNPFELLIATILAAQCTDGRVNEVTKTLFSKFPDSKSMAQAEIEELEEIVKPTGFFKNKAKSLKNATFTIIDKFSGNFPDNMKDLVSLPGVGRKTANVVLGNCFGVPVIIVDTHVKRVANRLGLANHKDPDKLEFEIKKLISEEKQTTFSYVINFHGRYTCKARKPACKKCVIAHLCSFPDRKK